MTNVAPTGSNDVIGVKLNQGHIFKAADFGFNDLDGNHLKEVIITTLPTGGLLLLGGVAVTAGDTIPAAEIANLNWAAPPGLTGDSTFTFQVVDNSGVAGFDTDLTANTLTLNVAAALATPGNIDLGDPTSFTASVGFTINGPAANASSGTSVSSAGDINGDGFDDLIIGAPTASPNGNFSGASYVVFGKASGLGDIDLATPLDGSNGFTIIGAAGEHNGKSVSSAGDVNGDGFDDLIIGAVYGRQNGSYSGASHVVFGKAGGFGDIDLATPLDGNNGFKINGAATGDFSGWSVSSAGDINGDGFEDLIIGSSFADPNGADSGASYVIFGKAGGFGDIDLATPLDGSNGFKINGAAAYDNSGYSVSSAGDINGDGFDDLIIGARAADPNGNGSGASYVVFGKASGFGNIDLATPLDGSNGFTISGASAGDYGGTSVSSVGDINGDGFDDVIVGASLADPNGASSGASYVLFGKAGGFGNIDLATPLDGSNGFKISGAAANDYSGFSVSSAGDFNGDGFDDLIVGAQGVDRNGYDIGTSYVLFGKANGFGDIDLAILLDGSNGFSISGAATYDNSGWSVSSAGDVNGDGFDDLIIGARGANSFAGASYVIFGHATNLAPTGAPTTVLATGLEDTTTYTITDAQLLAGFDDPEGDALAVAGLTADHGSFTHANGIWTYVAEKDYVGVVTLDYTVTDGQSTPIAATNAFTLTAVYSEPTGSNDVIGVKANQSHIFKAADFGFNDLDGNHLKEVIIATLPTGGSLMLGGVAVTAGQHVSAAQIGSLVWTAPTGFLGQQAFNFQVVDNSGVAGFDTDLTANTLTLNVAAGLVTPGNIGLGDPTSFTAGVGFKVNGAAAGDRSGWSVSSAGDINGDGFDDMIIGAPIASPNGNFSGASYVLFGKAGGLGDIDLAISLNGNNGFTIIGAAGEHSGNSVSSAGDINGDGFDDLIIGAIYASPNGKYSGASYVLFGKASGLGDIDLATPLNGSNGFTINGAAAGDFSGWSVSSAGDINGDGFDDLIIGSGFADPNGNSSGASYVIFGKVGGFADIDLFTPFDGSNGFRINGAATYDNSGSSVSSAGDINGDGFDDLIIGAFGADPNGSASGASYVFFGKASGFGNIDLATPLDGSNGFTINGAEAGDYSGTSVSSAGDVNGDGFDDLIIGAKFADPNGSASGASYVLFGKAGGFGNIDLAMPFDGSNGFKINGAATYDYSGFSVSSAGDFNGDGFDDLIIGTKGADRNGYDSGASYVLFGKASGFGNIDLATPLNGSNGFTIRGAAAYDISGWSVSSAGDVNGDGFDDLIIGAPYADANGNSSGASYVLFGHAINIAPTGAPTTVLTAGLEDTTTFTITDAQLLAGFTDPDGDPLSVAGLTANHGSFVRSGTSWSYVAEKDYFGVVALNYTVTDGQSTPIATAIGFGLNSVNDLPTGPAILAAGLEETTTYTITDAQLLAGFTDADGDPLSVASLTADHGTFTRSGSTWTYVAEKDYFGVVKLDYTVADSISAPVAATNSFTLTAVNDAPTGAPTTIFAAGLEDTTTTTITDAQLLAGFTDADTGDTLTAGSLTADHGTFIHANGIWTYVSEKDYFGKVALSYTVTDGKSTPVAATSSFDLTDVTDVFIGKGKARDVFVGTLGHDEFKGGRGNDTLTSNGLPDTFFFGKNAGRDKILGFDAVGDDHDLINLQGLKSFIKSFADLSDNHMVQQRKDVIIDDGHGDVITLKNVHLGDLDAADFLF